MVGSAGRAGRWIGGASRRLAGRQRRRDTAAEESEVEFKGQAERPFRRRESETGREAEPEMQQPESDAWSVRQGWKVGWRRKPQAGWKAAPKGSADDESRRLGPGGTGRLNEGASWKSAGRLSRKTDQRRKLETSRKAGRRIGKRRKSRVDRKAGLEGWPETQVEGWLDGRPKGWSPTQVGGAIQGKSKDLTDGKGR